MKEFARDVSFCSVPGDGGWPLGMRTHGSNELVGNLDAFEERRVSELKMRTNDLSSKGGNSVTELCKGETRQYDHKPRHSRNPLFGRSRESERRKLILGSVDESFEEHEQHRKRGLSDADLEDSSGLFMKVCQIDKDNKDIRSELDCIRIARQEIGCDCIKIKNITKMNEKRIREELKKRNHIGDSEMANMGKEELVKMLKELTQGEKCCSIVSDCECSREGIKCHWDVCACFRGSTNGGSGGSSGGGGAPNSPGRKGKGAEEDDGAPCGNTKGYFR